MIAQQPINDRRAHPRLANNIPVKICQDDGDLVTQTRNISRSGAYCKVNKYIEPMTKLKIHLLLPIKKGDKTTTKKISCQGVIVRVEPAEEENYHNVAIFFNDISQKDADNLAQYVNNYLEQTKA